MIGLIQRATRIFLPRDKHPATIFVADAGSTTYGKFLTYNAVGAFPWVFPSTPGGYFFSSAPIVKVRFPLDIVAIVIALLPAVYEFLRQHKAAKKEK